MPILPRRLAAALLLAAPLYAPALGAQATPAVAPPSAAQVALADSISRVMLDNSPSVREMIQRTLGTSGQLPDDATIDADTKARMATVQARMQKIVGEFVEKHVAADTVRSITRVFYAERFSEPELRSLLAFYRSDLGRKTLRLAPEMVTRMQTHMATIMAAHQGELQAAMMKAMSEP